MYFYTVLHLNDLNQIKNIGRSGLFMSHKNESQANYPEAQSIPTSNTHCLTSLQRFLWQKYFIIYIYIYVYYSISTLEKNKGLSFYL